MEKMKCRSLEGCGGLQKYAFYCKPAYACMLLINLQFMYGSNTCYYLHLPHIDIHALRYQSVDNILKETSKHNTKHNGIFQTIQSQSI